jgi:hypothetical protein
MKSRVGLLAGYFLVRESNKISVSHNVTFWEPQAFCQQGKRVKLCTQKNQVLKISIKKLLKMSAN